MTLNFHLIDTPDDAFRDLWNARVSVHDLSLDLDYLRLLAASVPEVQHHFLRVSDEAGEAGEARGLAYFSIARMKVAGLVPLRVLVLGGTIAGGKAFWWDEQAFDFASFLARFEAFAKGTLAWDILVLKEFSNERDGALLQQAEEAGFINLMCFDRSYLALPADGRMASFLDTLPSKRRRELRKVMAQADEAGLTVASHRQFGDRIDALYPLYLEVNSRATEARTAALPRALFEGLGRQREDGAARLLTVEQEGKTIGFGLLMVRQAQVKCMVIGLDHAVSREFQLWYLIVLRAIEHAMQCGCTMLDLGSTNHAMKRKFGATRDEIWIAVRHRSRWLTRLLAPLIRRTIGAMYAPRKP